MAHARTAAATLAAALALATLGQVGGVTAVAVTKKLGRRAPRER